MYKLLYVGHGLVAAVRSIRSISARIYTVSYSLIINNNNNNKPGGRRGHHKMIYYIHIRVYTLITRTYAAAGLCDDRHGVRSALQATHRSRGMILTCNIIIIPREEHIRVRYTPETVYLYANVSKTNADVTRVRR